jgi:hypothetical protein
MKIFLLDLWHDLKEKRLAPVAVVLLAALVAVPVLLAKPSSAPSAPAPVANAAGPKPDVLKQLAKVKLGDDAPGDGSTLGVFDPSDPFTPPKGGLARATARARLPPATRAAAPRPAARRAVAAPAVTPAAAPPRRPPSTSTWST